MASDPKEIHMVNSLSQLGCKFLPVCDCALCFCVLLRASITHDMQICMEAIENHGKEKIQLFRFVMIQNFSITSNNFQSLMLRIN